MLKGYSREALQSLKLTRQTRFLVGLRLYPKASARALLLNQGINMAGKIFRELLKES
jgi:hypothetical protein